MAFLIPAVSADACSFCEFINISNITRGVTDHALLTNLSADSHPQYILVSGTRAFTGKQSLGGFNLTDLLDPVAPQDAATKNYVDVVNTSMQAYVDSNRPITDHWLLSNLSADSHPQYLLVSGTRAMTGNLSIGSHYVTGVLDPFVGTDAATKNYVDLVNTSQTAFTSTAISTANTSMKNYVDAANTSMALNVSLNHASKVGGKVPTAELGSGSASATTYLRGDQSWATPPVVGYTLMVQGLSLATVTNSTVYVFGNAPKIPTTTTMGLNRIYIPKAGTIKAAEIFAYSTTAGSAETWGMDIALNSATGRTNMIQNITTSSTTRRWANQSMSTVVAVGDYIEIRSLCPAWGTKPAVVVFSGNIYIE